MVPQEKRKYLCEINSILSGKTINYVLFIIDSVLPMCTGDFGAIRNSPRDTKCTKKHKNHDFPQILRNFQNSSEYLGTLKCSSKNKLLVMFPCTVSSLPLTIDLSDQKVIISLIQKCPKMIHFYTNSENFNVSSNF